MESDWEDFYIRVWVNSRLPGIAEIYIDPQTVFAYCEDYGLRRTETLEIIKKIQEGAKDGKNT